MNNCRCVITEGGYIMEKSKKSYNCKLIMNSCVNFDSIACDCEIGVIPLSKEIKKHTFHLYPNDNSISYNYKDGKELINATNDRAVLPDLLAVRYGNTEDIKIFIETHGFLLPLIPNTNSSVESEFLFTLIHRLKATVSLIFAIAENDASLDYEKIMALTMYLLLTPQASIELASGRISYKTCPHDMNHIWHNTNFINENNETVAFEGYGIVDTLIGPVNVKDTVRPPFTEFNNYEHNAFIISEDNKPEYIRLGVADKATALFVGAKNVPAHCRLAIDFLFHFCTVVGDITKWNHLGELTLNKPLSHRCPNDEDNDPKYLFVNESVESANELLSKTVAKAAKKSAKEIDRLKNEADNPFAMAKFCDGFDDPLKDALVKLAKQTLKTEIEYNLKGVVPSYNTDALTSAWRVEYLLSGIYFSLFNIRAKEEQYRLCAKPNCGRYFFAKTDSIKQKYCSHSCTNAMAQSIHRRNQQESI